MNSVRLLSIFVCVFTGLLFLSSNELIAQDSTSYGKIIVEAANFENNYGNAMFALFNSKETFTENPIKGMKVGIEDLRAVAVFDSIPHGNYAIAVMHDEDEDGEMDSNIFGIPSEDYGFSNNARGTFGPPDWEEAMFQLSSDTLKLSIKVE